MPATVKKAVIPVAGLGTRMLPATKAIPKELLPVYDRPIIEHVVQEAISGGIEEIIFVTRAGKEAIENHFDAHYELEHRLDKKGEKNILGAIKDVLPLNVRVTSIRQRDALGLGHAVLCAKHLLDNEPFAVLLPDVLVLDQLERSTNFSFSQLVQAWNRSGIGQVMVEAVDWARVQDYGIADLDCDAMGFFGNERLRALVEKPHPNDSPSNLAVIGRYILPFRVFELLENTTAGVDGEIQLTDALDGLLRIEGLNALKTDADVYDCGNKHGFLSANLAVGMRDLETKSAIKTLMEKFL